MNFNNIFYGSYFGALGLAFKLIKSSHKKYLECNSDSVKNKVSEISKKIRYNPKNLYILESENFTGSMGIFGYNAIIIDRTEKCEEFAIAHELIHLKEHHQTVNFVATFSILVIGLIMKVQPIFIVPVIGLSSFCIYYIAESRADSGAISACSSLELANAHSFFRKNIPKNNDNFFSKIYNWIMRKIDTHPDIFSRMKKIKKEIECRRLANIDHIPLVINRFDSEAQVGILPPKEEHLIRNILCGGKKGDLFLNVSRLDIYSDRVDVWKHGYPSSYPMDFLNKDSGKNSVEELCNCLANSEPVIIICINQSSETAIQIIREEFNIIAIRKRMQDEEWMSECDNPTVITMNKK